MGLVELCRVLDCRLLQHQHLDDFIVHDCWRLVVVAGLAMRLARLLLFRLLRRPHRAHRRRLPHWLFRREPRAVRHLGEHVARFQSCRHG